MPHSLWVLDQRDQRVLFVFVFLPMGPSLCPIGPSLCPIGHRPEGPEGPEGLFLFLSFEVDANCS